jgi:hypothetical protein
MAEMLRLLREGDNPFRMGKGVSQYHTLGECAFSW